MGDAVDEQRRRQRDAGPHPVAELTGDPFGRSDGPPVGLETIDVDLPAVITTDLRLNEPRFIKLPDIMKAKSKPLETIAWADLGVDNGHQLEALRYAAPPKRQRGVMVKSVPELVEALKAKGLL